MLCGVVSVGNGAAAGYQALASRRGCKCPDSVAIFYDQKDEIMKSSPTRVSGL